MYTQLHRKILSMVSISRDGAGHWRLMGSRTIWVAEQQTVVTTKRAAYAAWRGDVLEGQDVRAVCGVPNCIRPEHLDLTPARRVARALSLPEQIIELAKPGVFHPPDPLHILPKGLTLKLIETVKFLSGEGNTTNQIRTATCLSAKEIVKIKAGVYDDAADALAGSRNSRRGYKDSRLARSAAEISGDTLPGAVTSMKELAELPSVQEEVEMSEEERGWLAQIGNG